MTRSAEILPLASAGLAWCLLLLAAWEGAVRRHRRGAAPVGAGHEQAEVRIAAWPFLFTCFWAAAALPGETGTSGWSELMLGVALAPPFGLLAIGLGIAAARAREFPDRLRWSLTPYHGIAGWILWLRALAARRDLVAGAPQGMDGAVKAADPEGSPRRGVRDLAEFRLEEVMIPRSQVVALQGAATVGEVVAEVRRRPHALYPVHGESVDQPLGVVRILDLAAPGVRDRPVRDLVRPAPILPETVRGLRLFQDLTSASIPAALVVDEYGGMAGLVTVEDLVEVLVGELEGEHEVVRARIVEDGPDAWRLDGVSTIEEINRRLGGLLPEGEFETVAGLVLDRLGAIPVAGEEVILPGVRLVVEEATDRRILWIRASRRDDRAEDAETGA